MSKVYEPTTNLFALLAEGADQPQRRTKNAAKGDEQELTPKERAAAKAVQDAERKAKREAEKAKQIEAEKRRKAIELANAGMDDTGFTQQRHQRIKEAKLNERSPVEAGKGDKADKPKGPKGPKTDKPFKGNKVDGRPEKKEYKGDKNANKPERPNRGREFDKHSGGVTGRKAVAKRGGLGKGNWDGLKPVPAGTTVEEAANSPSLVAKDTEVEETVAEVVPAVEGEEVAQTEETAAPAEGEEVVEEEDNEKTWEEFQAMQDAKAKELEALLGKSAAAQPRGLSDEETKALAKFTRLENTKTEQKKKAEPKPAAAAAAAPAAAKQSPIVIEFNLPRPARDTERRGGRGGRFGDKNRGDRQSKPRTATKKQRLPTGKGFEEQFPTLG